MSTGKPPCIVTELERCRSCKTPSVKNGTLARFTSRAFEGHHAAGVSCTSLLPALDVGRARRLPCMNRELGKYIVRHITLPRMARARSAAVSV